MLDMNRIRNEPEIVKEAMRVKGEEGVDIDQLLEWDARWRTDLRELEMLRAERNKASREVGRLKQQGEDAEELISRVRSINERISVLEEAVSRVQEKIDEALLRIPNIPHPDVPVGEGEEENVEIRRWGTPRSFSFDPRAHWDVGVELGILEFERAARIAGSRFSLLRAEGARLERALINFMLDLHVERHGYVEILPPFLVNRDCMLGTGQLPKFAEDVFRVEGHGYFLVPTAEVPVTNMYRDEIISGDDLPMRFVAYSPCFRSEAGAAGRDTRGLIRLHQFDKVELVQYTEPEKSYEAQEEILQHAEAVLQELNLPYRVVLMCTGDLGFGQTKKYDLEVWMPSYDDYVEISSVSNFGDFQARRANIRFRRE
ncbi:MAG: serine--tRNA ligase, partial [Bacillota bacterium]